MNAQVMLDDVVPKDLQYWADKVPPEGVGIVYVGLCNPSQKMYVGVHARGRNIVTVRAARWNKHRKGKTGRRLKYAIECHGKEAFTWYILEVVAIQDLGQRESFWISRLNTLHPHGYNLTTGGEHHMMSQDTIDKMIATRNQPQYVAALSKRRKEWAEENKEFFVAATSAGKRNSLKYRQKTVVQWQNKTKEEVEDWVEKHRVAAAAKRQQRLDACSSPEEVEKLKKYFAKVDRTKELQALIKAGLHVPKRRGPNNGRSGKARVRSV